MIGHFLLTLNEVQEDRALTMPMVPDSRRCLMITVLESGAISDPHPAIHVKLEGECLNSVALRYDALGARFGAPRINAAIRNRILSNRARRVLGHSLVSAGAP